MRFFSSSALAKRREVQIGRKLFCCRCHPQSSRSACPRSAALIWGQTPPLPIGGQAACSPLCRLRCQNRDRAAGLLDRRHRRFRGAPDREGDLGLDLAVAQQPHAVLGAAQDAGLDQRRGVDRGLGVELAGLDRGLHAAEIDLVELLGEGMLLKPRLGRRRCSGIWPPSKPLMRTPERAVWPLPPRPPVLPLPEPMPRPTRHALLARARPVGEFVELHRASSSSAHLVEPAPTSGHGRETTSTSPPTTRTRCATLAIMPRVCRRVLQLGVRPIR